jgi:hypothetical protein
MDADPHRARADRDRRADELAIALQGTTRRPASGSWRSAVPALFLFAQLLFHRAALGYAPRSSAIGIVTLATLAVAQRRSR